LHDFSICNLLGAAIPPFAGRNCNRLRHSLSSISLCTQEPDVNPHNTDSEEASCSAPRCVKKGDSCSIV
jgi:hypothetical protein